ncbi:DUF1045 domain-containing protein [Albimonas sp. CAU 1670]|uniref:DUF1045 domain-containing protein n=1 Tax=Albimonas sp. CAU 1670 TaxID=3032599 RepID=UPI0023DA1DAA|nr:DUF1045 domain-containing protein [Albimonas sp. CAU 1670]MDF2234368.1 DUF1045 domain-containing protein [Albimonas sp. CAU 1670]
MATWERLAIYYAPPADSALWAFGSAWLGWDAEAGAVPPRPAVEGLSDEPQALTVSPRRYGFHGTLKPPFFLAEGTTAEELEAEAEALAASLAPFDAPPPALRAESRFAYLGLSERCPRMETLASACVERLDRFRAPPSEAELARRRRMTLSPAQESHLARWGYPYVFDQFRFHLTLTSALAPETLAATAAALAPHVAPFCEAPLPVREIALFGDPGGGAPFRLLRRLPLGG